MTFDAPKILLLIGRPSRIDVANNRFMAGDAEPFVRESLSFLPDYKLEACDPATFHKTILSFVPTHIIATGEQSLSFFNTSAALNEFRGFVFPYLDRPTVCTFQAQDACDRRNFDADAFDLDDDDEDDAGGTGKDHAPTSWKNYRFWFQRDVRKLFAPPAPLPPFDQRIISAPECVAILNSLAGTTIYFDIETHPATDTVQCFSFNTPSSPTYTYLCYDYNGRANGNVAAVFAAWARAQRRNTIVIHNAGFDLAFLAHYHGVPFGRDIEDTMLMWHRAFPEAEKSLGHVISALLNEPFHKGTATFNPHNYAQQHGLLHYNGKDVHTLRAVHRELHGLAAGGARSGLAESYSQVNASIYPYLLAQFRGFELNTVRREEHKRNLSARVAQLTRVFRVLTGLPDINPNSTDQIAEWLIDGLGYKPVSTTDSGAPSMDAKAIYQYLLTYPNNVALKVLLAIKKQAKQLQMLGFEIYTNLDKR